MAERAESWPELEDSGRRRSSETGALEVMRLITRIEHGDIRDPVPDDQDPLYIDRMVWLGAKEAGGRWNSVGTALVYLPRRPL